jgi:hypothetical protein
MKYSGMTRPEVDERERLALDAGGEFRGGLQARFGVGNEVALEAHIFRPLCNRLGAGYGVSRLDAGEPPEPGELDVIVDERGDRSRISLHRHVLDWDIEPGLEVFGEMAEALDQARLVLVRDGREDEGG